MSNLTAEKLSEKLRTTEGKLDRNEKKRKDEQFYFFTRAKLIAGQEKERECMYKPEIFEFVEHVLVAVVYVNLDVRTV